MKFLILIATFLIIFGLSHFLDSSSVPIVKDEKNNIVANNMAMALPDFQFQKLTGEKVSISSFKGKTLILNFWASWCGPCEEEFPAMAKIIAENPNVVMIAVSSDETRTAVDKFLARLKKTSPELENERIIFSHDKSKEISSELFNVLRLPETFIINSQMQIVKKVIGSQMWLDGQMKEFISQLSSKKL